MIQQKRNVENIRERESRSSAGADIINPPNDTHSRERTWKGLGKQKVRDMRWRRNKLEWELRWLLSGAV